MKRTSSSTSCPSTGRYESSSTLSSREEFTRCALSYMKVCLLHIIPDREQGLLTHVAAICIVVILCQSLSYRSYFHLQHLGKTPVRIFLHVEYRPLSSRTVNRDEVPTLVRSVQMIESKVKDIILEIEHAKKQEAMLNAAGEVTTNRLKLFSVMSMAVLLGMAVWQVCYLRSFFTSKKLL
ncbi:emp24/gp25L/p24 family protein [archaeon]|nr:MAG: emp24/gp25L/p24 family protein [archaeon]